VEAGARCVTLSYSFWDWHGANFDNARNNLPDFDQAISALITDLDERGMSHNVTVIAWGGIRPHSSYQQQCGTRPLA
jgi:hypothetical protein